MKNKALIIKTPNRLFPGKNENYILTTPKSEGFAIPLGAIYVATYAKEAGGHDVKIADFNIVLKQKKTGDPLKIISNELRKLINNFKPNVIGFSGIFLADEKWVLYCSDIIKSVNKDITTVVGGSLATLETTKVMSGNHVDYAVVGEGEVIFKNILDCWPNHKKISRLKGVAFKKDGKIIINEREELIQDLDTIPMPDLSMVALKSYPQTALTRRVYLFSSRGCPFHCSFCSTFELWGRMVRYHSPDRVVEEVKRLRDVYNIIDFDFNDDNFTLNSERLKEICSKLEKEIKKSKTNFQWGCTNGMMVQVTKPESIKIMRKGGCRLIALTIESGCKRVNRDIIHKVVDYQKALRLRDIIRKEGIVLTSQFMIGIPGETLEEMHQTIDFIEKLNCDWNMISIYTAIPGTELYRIAEEICYFDVKVPHLRYLAALSTKDFTAKEVKSLQYDANIKYNFLRNRNVLRTENFLQAELHEEVIKHIVTAYNKHIIGKIVLGYEYWLDGQNKKAEYWWRSAKIDLQNPAVHRDFEPYLESKEEKPIKKWQEFLSNMVMPSV